MLKKELDDQLTKDFPNLYCHRGTDKYPISYGFQIETGWYEIVRELSATLEKMIQAIPEEIRGNYYCLQVKQKFGELRFYMSDMTEEMREEIRNAESKADETCECCGRSEARYIDPDTPREWGYVICKHCQSKKEAFV